MRIGMAIDLVPGFGAFTQASSSYLLDVLGVSAAAAYSTRKLRSAYSGNAIRVRRSSDSTEQDIGFSGENLDTAALSTFAGVGSAYVKTWYDQSGNGNNATQATGANQAPIYSSGALLTLGSKAAATFDIASYYYDLGSSISTAGNAMSAIVVAEGTGGASSERAFFGGVPGAFEFRLDTADTASNLRQQAANLLTTTGTVVAGANCLISVSATGSQIISINGSEESNSTSPLFNEPITFICSYGGGEYYTGAIGELIIFQSALSSGNRIAAEANVSAYWGTP